MADCIEAIRDSKLGTVYFRSDEDIVNELTKGVGKEDFFVASGDRNECLGFIWYHLTGAFHTYPYVHIVAVKKEFRGRGVGGALLHFFEEQIFPNHSKAFLLVGDFNTAARRLYERLGYQKISEIPDLHEEGVTEYLMMKRRPNPEHS